MKKKGLKVLGTALALAMVPAVVFGAGSISRPSSGGSGGGGGSHSSSSSSGSTITSGTGATVSATTTASKSTSVVTNGDGSKTSITSAVIDASTGYTVGVVVDNNGVTNDNGAAAVGDSRVSIATGAEKTAGLPDSVVNTIAAVDAGNVDAVPGLASQGYHKVSQSVALINKNAAGEVQVADVEVSLYCTTIPANGTFAILFYNNRTNTYSYLPVTSYDAARKTVSFILPTSGTAWIVAK